ncbi:hypothetical protein A9P82_12090 [Arachidicoccus ginsenosidimutans]|nr:hypothetical protein A9P82_12090 [Arachidicoccus sp. BS20]
MSQKQGREAIDSMLNDLKKPQSDTDRIKLIYRIGDAYTHIDPAKSLQYAKEGLTQAEKAGWNKGIAAFNISIGNVLSDAGKYDSSILYFKRAYDTDSVIGYKRGIISSLQNIGTAYNNSGNYRVAAKYFFKALPIAEKAGDYYNLSVICGNIAALYGQMDNTDKDLSYSEKALRYAEKTNNNEIKAQANQNLANAYLGKKDTGAAKIYYKTALSLYRKVNNQFGAANVYYALSVIERDIQKSILLGKESQNIWNKISPGHDIAIANLLNLGIAYLNQAWQDTLGITTKKDAGPSLDSARNFLKKGIGLSDQTNNKSNLGEFFKFLSAVNETSGDYKTALKNLKKADQINDSVYSTENRNKIAELEANYEFEKKEAVYKEQEKLSALKLRQLWVYAALALFIAIVFFLYFLNRYRIKQLRLKNAIQQREALQKERELAFQNQLAQSELKAIRAQMNPHFIFNVLNSIESYIMENDAVTASRLLQKFASLCRLTLENSTRQYVNAEREWQALKLYAELEAMRFNHQFSYEFELSAGTNLSELLIPPMMMQPIVENAIHHGLRNSADDNPHFKVTAVRREDVLIFITKDNGAGLAEAQKRNSVPAVKKKSLGLSLLRERISIINQSFGKEMAAFSLESNIVGHGAIAVLKLPVLRNG